LANSRNLRLGAYLMGTDEKVAAMFVFGEGSSDR